MTNTIDYDLYGHCVQCHKNMLIEQVVDNKVIKRMTPEYTETEFLLSDGSKMRVALCTTCKSNMKDTDFPKIMKCVLNGWQREIDQLVADQEKPQWTEEHAIKHMEEYSKKEIVLRTEYLHEDSIKKRISQLKEKENGSINK